MISINNLGKVQQPFLVAKSILLLVAILIDSLILPSGWEQPAFVVIAYSGYLLHAKQQRLKWNVMFFAVGFLLFIGLENLIADFLKRGEGISSLIL